MVYFLCFFQIKAGDSGRETQGLLIKRFLPRKPALTRGTYKHVELDSDYPGPKASTQLPCLLFEPAPERLPNEALPADRRAALRKVSRPRRSRTKIGNG
jgi:hypothetical protein